MNWLCKPVKNQSSSIYIQLNFVLRISTIKGELLIRKSIKGYDENHPGLKLSNVDTKTHKVYKDE